MEWLLESMIELVVWLDRWFQKPLEKAIPELNSLLADPRTTLGKREIAIGPMKRYTSAATLGISFGLLGWLIIGASLLSLADRRRDLGMLALVLLPGLPVVLTWFFLRVYRGGRISLKSGGVEFCYRGTQVFCPWDFFNAPGQPIQPNRNWVRLPVSAALVNALEVRRQDSIVSERNQVDTPQLRWVRGNEAILKAVYEVEGKELGCLLLRLGNALGRSVRSPSPGAPPFAADASLSSLGTRDTGGWTTVRLTRLAFPPRCCACGNPTPDRHEFRAHKPFLSLGPFLRLDDSQFVRIMIPLCGSCRRKNRRRSWKPVLSAIGVGFAVPILLGLVTVLFPEPFLYVILVWLIFFGPLLGLVVGMRLRSRRSKPVQLRQYSPRKGTVAIRFGNPEYAELMLEAMSVSGVRIDEALSFTA
jgi:hypothetical protein